MPRYTALHRLRLAALAAATASMLLMGRGAAQVAPVEPMPQPTVQCPAEEVSCTYVDRYLTHNGYRFQMLQICGVSCRTEFWVSTPDGQVLLNTPMHNTGILAVRTSGAGVNPETPPVRVVVPLFAATDRLCCPSEYSSTVYEYNPAGSFAPTPLPNVPAASLEDLKQSVTSEGWTVVLPLS
jgi:hypothetical protein